MGVKLFTLTIGLQNGEKIRSYGKESFASNMSPSVEAIYWVKRQNAGARAPVLRHTHDARIRRALKLAAIAVWMECCAVYQVSFNAMARIGAWMRKAGAARDTAYTFFYDLELRQ